MVHYKMFYYNCRARAETLRMLLKVASFQSPDVEVEEVNWYSKPEWFETWKAKSPLGHSPWLEIDGVEYAQSLALERYIAENHGMMGNSKLDGLKCAMLVETIKEAFDSHMTWFSGSKGFPGHIKGDDLDASLKVWQEKTLPGTLATLEKLAAFGGKGHFIGDSVSWADIKLYTLMDWTQYEAPKDIINNYPRLKEIMTAVETEAPTAEHIKNRKPHLTSFGY